MTVKEKLVQEFSAAVSAIFGDIADYDANTVEIKASDIEAICKKVKFYLDL